jgi:hypothetical protein
MFGVMSLANPAWGQPPTRSVKNVDEKGRVPYQTTQLIITSTCSFNSILYFCDHTLPAVPAGKRLVVEHITMFAALASGVPDSLRFLNPVSNGTLFWVQPTFTPRAIDSAHSFLDRPVHVYYEPGQSPMIRLQTTGQPVSVEFTVHGYLIDAENDA